jgi:hypothetical protein
MGLPIDGRRLLELNKGNKFEQESKRERNPGAIFSRKMGPEKWEAWPSTARMKAGVISI